MRALFPHFGRAVDIPQSSGYAQAVDYLRAGGTLMAVGLPGEATLNASIFFTVYKVIPFPISLCHSHLTELQSLNILGSYVGNRQDAREAIDIAARGDVKVHFALEDLSHLKE